MTADITGRQHYYLAELYRLQQKSDAATLLPTSDLAEAIQDTHSTTGRMIERLRARGWVRHVPYQGVQLTASGRGLALRLLRKRRIIMTFLANVMGFDWSEVYDEAIVQRMWGMAGTPTHDPFGEPTPHFDGTLPSIDDVSLADAAIECDYRISCVLTRQAERLDYLSALHLIPGTVFYLLHRAPFNGSLQLQLRREYRIIGHELAALIRVVPA